MSSSYASSSTALPYDDNNEGVPVWVHVGTTLIVLIVFSVSLEQACSLSIKHKLFKIRVGVLISNAILSVLSMVLNLDLLRTSGYISFLDAKFVLIVRTLQIIWLSVAFFIGYFFVIYSINSAYRSSTLLYSANSNNVHSEHSGKATGSVQSVSDKTPNWMSRFWFVCTVFIEIAIFLCFIIAFSTTDILYIHICWICSFLFTIIGALLVSFAILDICKYVYNKTRSSSLSLSSDASAVSAVKLKKLTRLLITIVILCVASITAAAINLVTILRHISRLDRLQRANSLNSTAIDNVADYVSYFLILLCVELSFVIWTYKPNAVNYCLFCCCAGSGRRKYSQSFRLDKTTMCYAFCQACLENAERKRRAYLEAVQRLQSQQHSEHDEEQRQAQQQPHTQSPQQQQTQLDEAGNVSTPQMVPRQVTGTVTQNPMQRPSHFSITAAPVLSGQQQIVLDDADEVEEQQEQQQHV